MNEQDKNLAGMNAVFSTIAATRDLATIYNNLLLENPDSEAFVLTKEDLEALVVVLEANHEVLKHMFEETMNVTDAIQALVNKYSNPQE